MAKFFSNPSEVSQILCFEVQSSIFIWFGVVMLGIQSQSFVHANETALYH